MAEDSDLERTEPASARKLDQAREQGNVPRSRELATLAVLLASVGVIAVIGLFMFRGLHRVMRNTLSFDAGDVASPAMMGRNLMDAGMDGMLLFLPLAVAVVVAAVAANVLISGWVFSTKAFEFDFAKLNPITGLGRLFSWNSLAELVKALMKGGLIAGVAGWMIWHQRHQAAIALHRTGMEDHLLAGVVEHAPAQGIARRVDALATPATAHFARRGHHRGMQSGQQRRRQYVGTMARLP